MELERLGAEITKALQERFELPDFRPGKVSVWIKLAKLVSMDGAFIEETVGPVAKQVFVAASPAELIRDVVENMLLNVFGAEVLLVKEMPNVVVKLFDKKVRLHVQGAPPLEQPGQIFLKATVYAYSESLWDQLFRRKQAEPGE